jgi:hypothetical protein
MIPNFRQKCPGTPRGWWLVEHVPLTKEIHVMSARSFASALTFAFAVALASTGCGSPSSGGTTSTSVASSTESLTTADAATSSSAIFARYLVAPDGRIDGLLTRDGAAVRFPPFVTADASLAAGDALTIVGKSIATPTGAMIVRAKITKGDVVIADASASPERHPEGPHGAGGPPPFAHGPHGPRGPMGPGMHGPTLSAISASGTVATLLSRPDGALDALVLDDGTTARLPPSPEARALKLSVGDTVSLEGRGTAGTAGKGMFVETVKIGAGEVIRIAPPPPVVTAIDQDAKVQRAITSPFGGLEGVLLDDGRFVRLPPFADASKLGAGTAIHLVGSSIGAAVHAETITAANGDVLFAKPTERPAGPPRDRARPPALADVAHAGTIASIVRGPMGEASMLLLSDGAVVMVPPPVARDAGDALVVGQTVSASGRGGTYASGVSMFATSLTLASGKVVTAPPRGEAPPFLRDVPAPAAPRRRHAVGRRGDRGGRGDAAGAAGHRRGAGGQRQRQQRGRRPRAGAGASRSRRARARSGGRDGTSCVGRRSPLVGGRDGGRVLLRRWLPDRGIRRDAPGRAAAAPGLRAATGSRSAGRSWPASGSPARPSPEPHRRLLGRRERARRSPPHRA